MGRPRTEKSRTKVFVSHLAGRIPELTSCSTRIRCSQSRRVVADECIMINLASLLLLSFAEVVVSPISKVQSSPSAITRTKEIGLWYNVLFSWPVFIVCFWINVSAVGLLDLTYDLQHLCHRPAGDPTSRNEHRLSCIRHIDISLLHPLHLNALPMLGCTNLNPHPRRP